MNASFIFIIIIFISFPSIYQSQNSLYNKDYQVEYLTVRDGLAHGCIQSIIQDSDGFLWFATEGGLNRYDGYDIKLYPLPDNFIFTVVEDTSNIGKYLWIGTNKGGVIKFDMEKGTFQQYLNNPNDSSSISSNSVKCIYKDSNGILWIGTLGGGLNKFDLINSKFISFQNDPSNANSINSNQVSSICEDYLGNLWIGTLGGGLEKFDCKSNIFQHYKYDENNPKSLSATDIYALLEDNNRILWVTTEQGIFKYDRENNGFIRHIFENNDTQILNYGLIYSLSLDRENTIWIPAQDRGVISIPNDRKNFNYYPANIDIQHSLNSTTVSSVLRDRSGIIWVGTFCKGINKIIPTKKHFEHFQHKPGDNTSLTSERIFSLYEDENCILWLGTGEGLAKVSDHRFIKHSFFDDWFYENIFNVIQSKDGKLWLARGRCLTEYDPKTEKYKNYFGKYLIYSSPVFELVKKVLSSSPEISRIKKVTNNQILTREFEIKKLSHSLVISAGEGNLTDLIDYGWITTGDDKKHIWEMSYDDTRYYGGSFNNRIQISLLTLKPGKYLLHYLSNKEHGFGDWKFEPPFDPESWGISVFPISNSDFRKYVDELRTKNYSKLHWNDLHNVVEDNFGRIWCTLRAAENTIHYFDKLNKHFIPFSIIAGDRSFFKIESIIKDSKDRIWFISPNNVLIQKDEKDNCKIKFDLREVINDTSVFISVNSIGHVYEDSKSNFWIGTNLGLFKYNLETEKINHYKNEEFTIPNKIKGIIEDTKGVLWISTEYKILKFYIDRNLVRSFDHEDGLPNILFDSDCCILRKNGEIVFGGENGIVSFDPNKILQNNIVPNIILTDFQIYNNSISPGPNSPLKKMINKVDEIILTHDQNNISFTFSALDYTSPIQNKYAVMMKGIDTNWIYQKSAQRNASYNKLYPGTYVFRVKGSNNDGIWNETGASVKIIILPPWWATWWFRLIAVFLLLSLIYRIYKYRVTRLLEMERMRVQIASDLHDDVGSSLTKIAIHSEIIQSTQDRNKITSSSAKIGYISREIITSFSDIIWSIDARNDTVGDLIDRIRDYLDTVFPTGTILINFKTSGLIFKNNISQEIRQNIYLIFKEAINNAAKHSEASEIEINIANGNGTFRLEISDNGKGLDLNDKISGNHGLQNMKLRTKRLGGKLSIENINGTKISLTVKEL